MAVEGTARCAAMRGKKVVRALECGVGVDDSDGLAAPLLLGTVLAFAHIAPFLNSRQLITYVVKDTVCSCLCAMHAPGRIR